MTDMTRWFCPPVMVTLLDAVEFLAERGKRIELAVFTKGVSTDLQARADRIYWIDDFAEEVSKD